MKKRAFTRERRIPGKMLGAAVAVPLRSARAAESESSARRLSRACLLAGRDGLLAGCWLPGLGSSSLQLRRGGLAPHMHAATPRRRDVTMVSSKLPPLTLPLFS